MIDKIIYTRDKETLKIQDQLEFIMPVGYQLISPKEVYVQHQVPTVIDFKIKIYSKRAITLIFTEAIHSTDFKIIDKVQMIAPLTVTDLKITVLNPNPKCNDWHLLSESLVATMVPVETVSINLFEMSNNKFEQYV